jgi:hypothetical protein
MRQAILTKFLSPTNVRSSRVKASAGKFDGKELQVTLNWDHGKNVPLNHIAAAHALATKLNWTGKWHGGGVDNGYAFVLLDDAYDSSFKITDDAA